MAATSFSFINGSHYDHKSGGLFFNRPWRWEAAVGHWFVWLSSADSAKDRTVANIRRLAVFLQPLGHVTTDRQIRQIVRRPSCAPQFDRSLPCQLAIWLARRLRRGRLGCHLAIKPFEKILFDDRKLRAADRVDVLISDDVEFARLKRLSNDCRSFFAACIKALANE